MILSNQPTEQSLTNSSFRVDLKKIDGRQDYFAFVELATCYMHDARAVKEVGIGISNGKHLHRPDTNGFDESIMIPSNILNNEVFTIEFSCWQQQRNLQ